VRGIQNPLSHCGPVRFRPRVQHIVFGVIDVLARSGIWAGLCCDIAEAIGAISGGQVARVGTLGQAVGAVVGKPGGRRRRAADIGRLLGRHGATEAFVAGS